MKGHSQDHHAHHHQDHLPSYDRAFLIAIVLNGLFTLLQIFFSYIAHSTSLLADAIHNLGDVLSLVLAWMATHLMLRKPTEKTTYGLKKTSILAALTNGILLTFTCGIIVTEAVYKLLYPTQVQALSVMLVAGIGIIVNSSTALLFMRGSEDLNIRGAYLHLVYDALISVGVVLAGAIIFWTGWLWVDPLAALLIVAVILKGTWALFKDSFRLIIDGVPSSISLTQVSEFLLDQAGVKEIHDLHIWAMSTKENAMSVHLYMPEEVLSDQARVALVRELEIQFSIQHVTIQTEQTKTVCQDACHTPYILDTALRKQEGIKP